MDVIVPTKPLDLTTIGSGALNEEFREAVAQMLARSDEHLDAIRGGAPLYATKDGQLVAKCAFEVTISVDPERGTLSVSYAMKTTYPNRRPVPTNTRIVNGTVVVESDDHQDPLPMQRKERN